LISRRTEGTEAARERETVIAASGLTKRYGDVLAVIDLALNLLGLEGYAERRADRLSMGNKQRLSLARALLHSPEVLVLDEPANALDPAGIVEVRTLLRKLADERGTTVFMSSHILAEVAHLADRVGIIHEGRMVEELDDRRLHAQARVCLEVGVSDAQRAAKVLSEKLGLGGLSPRDRENLRIEDPGVKAEDVARVLVEAGLGLRSLEPVEEDLEARFMRLTGKNR
jgi:ABC-2 type transport system ATP-binding protein